MSRPGSRDARASGGPALRELPSALERCDEILRRLARGRPLFCLDYDGTLTAVVEHPDLADLTDETRDVLRRLARRWAVAVVSGRDAEEIRRRVGVEGIHYAGSHGLEMLGPGGDREIRGEERMPDLDRAEATLRRDLDGFEGVWVERKRLAIAVHVRQAERELLPRVAEIVRRVADSAPALRRSRGKEVLELRPDVDWHKGRAVERLMETAAAEGSMPEGAVIPLYIGDDVTDEDAFRTVREGGVGIAVRGEGDDRSTWARYSLADPDEVRIFLTALLEGLHREPPDGGEATAAGSHGTDTR